MDKWREQCSKSRRDDFTCPNCRQPVSHSFLENCSGHTPLFKPRLGHFKRSPLSSNLSVDRNLNLIISPQNATDESSSSTSIRPQLQVKDLLLSPAATNQRSSSSTSANSSSILFTRSSSLPTSLGFNDMVNNENIGTSMQRAIADAESWCARQGE